MTLPLFFFFFGSFFFGGIKFYLYWLINEFFFCQTCFQVLIEHHKYLFQCSLVFGLWFSSFWGTEFYIFKELNFSLFPSCLYMCALSFSYVQLFATPVTVACQVPLSMGFSRQKYWGGLPFPPPGDYLDPEMETTSLVSPILAGVPTWESPSFFVFLFFFTTAPSGKPLVFFIFFMFNI